MSAVALRARPAWSWTRLLPLACALPTLAAAAVGLGAWIPGAVEALALGTLLGWAALLQRRLRQTPAPGLLECGVAGVGALSTAICVLNGGLSGYGSGSPPELAHLLRLPTLGLVVVAAGALAALATPPAAQRAAAWLRDLPPPPGALPLAPPCPRNVWIVVLAGAVVQGVSYCAHPGPLVQIDSFVNLLEPPLFQYGETPFHHTPIYAELIKLATHSAAPQLALSLLVALQHLSLIGVALILERTVRLLAGSLAGLTAGLLVACCGHLALFAQLVMSETFSTGLLVVATACVFEAPRRARPFPWLVAGGVASALATLTRQAMQGWFVAGAIAVVLLRLPHRWRALGVYLAAALLPLAGMVLHNGVFLGRFSLTAGLGRTLHYRVGKGLPDLTDPDAPPGDPYERARELIWKHRTDGWLDSYSAINRELGWDDAQVEAAMKRFYVEQIVRHPVPFTRITLDYCWTLIWAKEDVQAAFNFHDQTIASYDAWGPLPHAEPGRLARWVYAFQPTSTWPVLLLGLLSPLLAYGRGRVLALTCLASIAYFVVITSLIEWPVPRYRIPAIPFFAAACALSVGGLVRRSTRLLGRAQPSLALTPQVSS
ncbi:MAG: hypothetical protein R3F62_16455 [Planctomycetota bacterium]